MSSASAAAPETLQTTDEPLVIDRARAAIHSVPGLPAQLWALISSLSNEQAFDHLRQLTAPDPRELFDALDLDRDGVISYPQLAKAFRGRRKRELRELVVRLGTDWKSLEGRLGRLVASSEPAHSPTDWLSPRTGWITDREGGQKIRFKDFQSCLSTDPSVNDMVNPGAPLHGEDRGQIQSRLLDFIQTKRPTDLTGSSNLGKSPAASPSHSPGPRMSPRTGKSPAASPSLQRQKQLQRLSRMPFRQLLLYAKANGVEERAANMALDCDELIQLIVALPEIELTRSVSLSLTRDESFEALATLSAMGEVDRQTSLGRLPQIGEASQGTLGGADKRGKTIGQDKRDDPSAALRRRYANATGSELPLFFEQLHRLNHQLEDTEEDSRLTCYKHEPFEAAPEGAYDLLTPTTPAANALTPTHLPTPSAERGSTPPDRIVEQQEQPFELARLRETDRVSFSSTELPYSWQLAHELMVDDSFGLTADGLVLPDPVQRRALQIFLRAADDSEQQELADALAQMSSDSQSTAKLEEVLTTVLGRVGSCLDAMHTVASCQGPTAVKDLLNTSFIASSGSLHRLDSTAVRDLLNASYIVQMVKGGAYGCEQLRQLIRYVCHMAADMSILETPPILGWLEHAEQQLAAAQGDEQVMVQLAAPLLSQLIVQLTELYTLEKNARLAMQKEALIQVGAEYEREQVAAAVYRGDLTLDRTAPWLDAAWETLGRPQLSRDVIVRTHRLAMQTLITRLSLENTHELTTEKLPEILALDCARMSSFRGDVRKLAIGVALHTLAKNVLHSAGVLLSDSEASELQKDLLNLLETAGNSGTLASGAADLLQLAASDKLSRLPSKDKLVDALIMATSRRQSSNLRTLFTERIAAAVVTVGLNDEQVHSSLKSVKEQLRNIAVRVDKLCSHLEQAYAQLYTALLGSQQQ